MTHWKTLTTTLATAALVAGSAMAAQHTSEEDGAMAAGEAQMSDGAQTDGAGMDGTAETARSGDTGETGAETFSDELLNTWVATVVDVQETRQDWVARIRGAEDTAEAEALAAEAEAELLAIVEEAEGLTVEEYMAVGNAAQTDPDLAERLAALFSAEMEGRQGSETDDG